MRPESDLRTFIIALVLAVICSFFVAGANVLLKPRQDMNRELERKKNILLAAGVLQADTDVNSAFEAVETYLVDMRTGNAEKGDAGKYFESIRRLASSADAVQLNKQQDVAVIKSIPAKIPVFILRDGSGQVSKVVLPIYGSGLWSTMYGFMALNADLNTVSGITFYDHGETPGLGGEIDNPLWKAGWVDKKIYGDDGSVVLSVVKGAKGDSQIDSLSGATMTSRGVENTVRFWMGADGYGKFLASLKQGGA
ncbi:Na(+)-translocating NADH-quinone reductase subunit C [Seleniivibrio woodruffii]|uniref:Na(+)-translocating NADH-quinone reductase subunit C n=1 Tax=Seleniivibrio woodruffii TaxID=1078050 RepID=UPI0039E2D6AE